MYGAQVAGCAAGGLLAVAGAHGHQDSLAAELAEGGRFPGLYMLAAHPEPRVRALVGTVTCSGTVSGRYIAGTWGDPCIHGM